MFLAIVPVVKELTLTIAQFRHGDHDSDVIGRSMVIEEIGCGDGRVAILLPFQINSFDLSVHKRGLPRDSLEHGVAAQSVEVGTCIGEG